MENRPVLKTKKPLTKGTVSLLSEIAAIDAFAKRDRESFRQQLIEWVAETNRQPGFKPLEIPPEWKLNRILAELDDDRIRALSTITTAIDYEHLRGEQLSFLAEVEPYWIENPKPKIIKPKSKSKGRKRKS